MTIQAQASDRMTRLLVVHLRDHVLVEQWDWPAVRDSLTRIFGQTTGDDWESIAVRLSRWGRWEFA